MMIPSDARARPRGELNELTYPASVVRPACGGLPREEKRRKDGEQEHLQRALAKKQRTVDFGLTCVTGQLAIAHAERGMISIEDATGMPGHQHRASSRRIESFCQWAGFLVGGQSIRRS